MAKAKIYTTTREVEKTVVDTVETTEYTLTLSKEEILPVFWLLGSISGAGPVREIADRVYFEIYDADPSLFNDMGSWRTEHGLPLVANVKIEG